MALGHHRPVRILMPDFKEVIVVPSGVGLWPSARDLRSGPATGRAVLLSGPDYRLLGTWRWSGRGRRCRRRCRRTSHVRRRLLVRPGITGLWQVSPAAPTCPGTTACAWTSTTWRRRASARIPSLPGCAPGVACIAGRHGAAGPLPVPRGGQRRKALPAGGLPHRAEP
jgi:hypothetical protein